MEKQKCIETMIRRYKDAVENKRAAVVKLNLAQSNVEEAEELERKLFMEIDAWAESHGFDIRVLNESEESPDHELVITDWRDLQVGDIVEVVMVNKRGGTDGYDDIVGKQCRVILTEDPGIPQQAVKVDFEGDGVFIHKWKFIHRPAK